MENVNVDLLYFCFFKKFHPQIPADIFVNKLRFKIKAEFISRNNKLLLN